MSAHGDAMVAARAELDDSDLRGRADLLAVDLTRLALSVIFKHRETLDQLSDAELEFGCAFKDELHRGLRNEAEMIFLVEHPASQSEAREAVAVADDSIQQVVLAALKAAEGKHPVRGLKAAEGLKVFRRRVREYDLDSPKVKADREAWIQSLPATCANCGDEL